jgi:hypothetical protein
MPDQPQRREGSGLVTARHVTGCLVSVIDLLSSPFFYRIFITGHRVEPDLAEKLVDFVLLRDIPKKSTTSQV